MSEQELKSWIISNLRIELVQETEFGPTETITARLCLEDIVVSSSTIDLPGST